MSEATDIVYLKFFTLISAKKTIKLDKLKIQKAKRVQVRVERKFRDIPGILPRPGHRQDRAQIPGLSRPFRDGWQLCNGISVAS